MNDSTFIIYIIIFIFLLLGVLLTCPYMGIVKVLKMMPNIFTLMYLIINKHSRGDGKRVTQELIAIYFGNRRISAEEVRLVDMYNVLPYTKETMEDRITIGTMLAKLYYNESLRHEHKIPFVYDYFMKDYTKIIGTIRNNGILFGLSLEEINQIIIDIELDVSGAKNEDVTKM